MTIAHAYNDVWATWTTATSTSAVCPDTAWQNWISVPSTTATSTGFTVTATQNAWIEWTLNYAPIVAHCQPTAEEVESARLDRERRDAEWRANEAARLEREEAAKRRALMLLMALLNTRQRREYRAHNRVHVRSQSGKRYRINGDRYHGNIELVDAEGNVLKRLCVAPRASLPQADHMAAQLLYLKHNENELVEVANVTDVATGQFHAGRRAA